MNFVNGLCVIIVVSCLAMTRSEAKTEHKGVFYTPVSVVSKYANEPALGRQGLTDNQRSMLDALAKHMGGKTR